MTTTALPPVVHRPAALVPVRKRRARLVRAVGYAVLVLSAVAVLLPFAWMLISSLKSSNDVFTVPIQWWPSPVRWRNFLDIWHRADMLTWLFNTVLLSVGVTALQVFTGSFAAYGFSRVRFPGRDMLFLVYVATLALPWQAYMIPQFILMSKLGLTDTRWSIIALQAFGAFGVFLMRQYYASVPEDLSEAARLDGLSEFGIYRRIMLPLSTPAVASLALLTFVTTWNDYMGPLIYLRDPSIWTIQLGLKTFANQYNTDYAMVMAGSVLSVLPVAAIFVLGQRFFIEGIASSGVKG